MPTLLLADSGSTKTEWCLCQPGLPPLRLRTDGLNPYFQTEKQLRQTLQTQLISQLPDLPTNVPIDVFFYGAGCTSPDKNDCVAGAIRAVLPAAAHVGIASDMLGAARAVAGREPGIVCILGTGSNVCFYDGAAITSPGYALGFWLGDEGSGGNLGKRLVTAYLHYQLPEPLRTQFQAKYGILDRLTVLDNAYNKPYPNRYFASFALFLSEHPHPFVSQLLTNAFTDFVRLYVLRLPEATAAEQKPVHLVGSVAYHFTPYLEQVLSQHQLRMGQVMQAPMDGLVRYHG